MINFETYAKALNTFFNHKDWEVEGYVKKDKDGFICTRIKSKKELEGCINKLILIVAEDYFSLAGMQKNYQGDLVLQEFGDSVIPLICLDYENNKFIYSNDNSKLDLFLLNRTED